MRTRATFPLTAAGVTTLYAAGEYDSPVIRDALDYMDRQLNGFSRDWRGHYFFFYGNYYATQAWYTRGGKQWTRWYTRLRDDLLSIARHRRGADGKRRTYWESRHVGDAFATAVASIILQVPNHYLPIFQR